MRPVVAVRMRLNEKTPAVLVKHSRNDLINQMSNTLQTKLTKFYNERPTFLVVRQKP